MKFQPTSGSSLLLHRTSFEILLCRQISKGNDFIFNEKYTQMSYLLTTNKMF